MSTERSDDETADLVDPATSEVTGGEAAEGGELGGDPWPALQSLAELLNDLATRIEDHEQRLGPPPPAPPKDSLEEWVSWLTVEYGLDGVLGNQDRWANTPPVRHELAALRVASDVLRTAKAGSFEPVYFHDALARVLDRVPGHYSRWLTNQTSLQAANVARSRNGHHPAGTT